MSIKKFLAGAAGSAFLLFSVAVFATHIPVSADESIDYDGSAVPGTLTGFLDGDANEYDWYCATAVEGQEVQVQVTRTSGDLLPNAGAFEGLAEDGESWGDVSGDVIANTSNSTSDTVTLTFTPDFSGAFSIWISTFTGETGDYEAEVTGAEEGPANCGVGPPPPPALPVPTLSFWTLLLLAGALAIVGTTVLRRRQV